jgi:hypothetical protein
MLALEAILHRVLLVWYLYNFRLQIFVVDILKF